MILYNNENEFEVKIHTRITPKLKVEFVKKLQEYKVDPNAGLKSEALEELVSTNSNIMKYLPDIKENESWEKVLPNMNFAAMIKYNNLSALNPDPEVLEHNTLVLIDLFKIIINRKDLKEEEIKLIDTLSSGEFWQNQTIGEIEAEVNSFRSLVV